MSELTVQAQGSRYLLSIREDALSPAERRKLLSLAGEDEQEELTALLTQAEAIAHPRLVMEVFPVEEKGEDWVVISGVRITSALMRKNLDAVGRVFAYVGTCGPELEEWAKAYHDDFLAEYWCEEIRKVFLGHILAQFSPWIREKFSFSGYFATMNPGSIREWPLTGQSQLFHILDRQRVFEDTGVTLTDSMLMLPSKSVSGLGFESGAKFENCSRCPILRCPNRRAAPDPDIETR